MSYRFPDPNPVLISLLGTESAADGTLQFYDYQTTTPKATYSDRDLTTPNANPVELDASGRAETEIWLDGEYTAVLRAADTTVIWTRDIVPEVAPGTALPDPTDEPGGTVKSTGVGYELVLVMELPDPTDSAGKLVVVNASGTGYDLIDQPEEPEIPDPEIVINDSAPYSVRVGVSDDATKFFTQYGTESAPASGSRTTSVTVTLPTALDKVFHISISPATLDVGEFGIGATYAITGWTLGSACSSFTVSFNSADDGGDSGYPIEDPISFAWKAEGTVTVS